MAMTSRPSSVNSCARIEPVQPRPMIATSFLGSFWAMGFASGLAGVPIDPSLDADGGTGVAFVMPGDPIAVIVAGARITDHAPRAHVSIAAVDRIGEKS